MDDPHPDKFLEIGAAITHRFQNISSIANQIPQEANHIQKCCFPAGVRPHQGAERSESLID